MESVGAQVDHGKRSMNRRRFVTAAGISFAAAQLGMFGCARSTATKSSTERTANMTQVQEGAGSGTTGIREFRINVPENELVELRRRIAATRWPDRETVDDLSQGVQLATIRELVEYWGSSYDWRNVEAKLNSLPNFMTNIDGVDIHFIHVKSRHPNALPMIMTHGWPGSVLELLGVIDPLTNPTAHGGSAADAFDLVLPSMPGYGFSERPKTTGWDGDRMARAWAVLMERLGYTRYVSQGGDWGSVISDKMAAQKPAGLVAIHVNMPGVVPPEIARVLQCGDPAPANLPADELAAFNKLNDLYKRGNGYAIEQTTKPQTLGYGISDSPAGLAAWFYEKFAAWSYTDGHPERELTKDQMLDDITLYWLTNTPTSSARLYWENNANNFNAVDVSLPAAITVFPGELYQTPRSWARRAYRNLVYFNVVDKGGHFAAWEQPALFSQEMRAAFRQFRSSDS
jgi:pimeloyl-ACP methyl ester carboxylesterase